MVCLLGEISKHEHVHNSCAECCVCVCRYARTGIHRPPQPQIQITGPHSTIGGKILHYTLKLR